MKLKTLLLASATFFATLPAMAIMDFLCPQCYYIEGKGGAIWQGDTKIMNENGGGYATQDYKTGYEVGGAIGAYMSCFRAEIEGMFRNSPGDKAHAFDPSGNPAPFAAQPHFYYRSFSLMFNALYDFYFCDNFSIYVGGGLGAAWVEFDCAQADFVGGGSSKPHLNMDNIRFAYQGLAGISYKICDDIILSLGTRAWATVKEKRHHNTGNPTESPLSLSDEKIPFYISAELGLRFVL